MGAETGRGMDRAKEREGMRGAAGGYSKWDTPRPRDGERAVEDFRRDIPSPGDNASHQEVAGISSPTRDRRVRSCQSVDEELARTYCAGEQAPGTGFV